MKKLLIIGSAAALLVLACLFVPTGSAWHGGATVQCQVRVVDSWTHNGVEHAKIRIIRDTDLEYLSGTNSHSMFREVVTDGNGDATVPVFCGAGGNRTLLRRTGGLVISHQVFVEAEGYVPLSVALVNLVGKSEWPLSKKDFKIELVMSKRNREG